MMKNLVIVVALAACSGPKTQTPVSNSGSGDGAGPVKDTRTELEKRRDAACETLGPRITECAVQDAKAALAAGKTTQKEFDATTKSEVLAKNTSEFVEDCGKREYSSRQVRVLEVCQKEEPECDPMLSCLDNLKKQ